MELNNLHYWLIAGVVFSIAEAIGMSGFGLIFAGFGGLSVGMLINFGVLEMDSILPQFVVFFIATILWELVLWKPLEKWRKTKGKSEYHNIIGQTAIVAASGLIKENGGQVTWSGAIMKAKFVSGEGENSLQSGAKVVIKDIIGNTLIVSQHIDK